MIQCARAAGLAHVLENLMGFDGDEFYLKEWPEIVGERFGDIFTRFDDAVPLGIKHNGVVVLNPPDDQVRANVRPRSNFCPRFQRSRRWVFFWLFFLVLQ
jgi:hypothetical protein